MGEKRLFPAGLTENQPPLYPWYKERLKTKCLQDTKNKQRLSGALNGSRWHFLNPGLVDFRDGYPSCTGEQDLARAHWDVSPAVLDLGGSACGSEQRPGKRLTKEQACFSRQNPRQQVRRQRVTEVERSLMQCPLALNLHLEESVAPELFSEVVSVLNPEMNVSGVTAVTTEEQENDPGDSRGKRELGASRSSQEVTSSAAAMPGESRPKNAYACLQRKNHSPEGDQVVKHLSPPSEDEDIRKVSKQFCDWVISLGGESNNLSEAALLGLFDSGYERKPSRSIPIQVVDPKSLPGELQFSVEAPQEGAHCDSLRREPETPKRQPGKTKIKYGAWYLDPKTWKKMSTDEPLQDPSAVSEEQGFSDHPSERDEELKQLHSTLAFRQFILDNGLREPRFLQSLLSGEEQE